jgi:hypothetical protein
MGPAEPMMHSERPTYKKIEICRLGYLNAEGVKEAERILSGGNKRRKPLSALWLRHEIRKASAAATILILILVFGAVLPKIFEPEPSAPKSIVLGNSHPDLIGCDEKWAREPGTPDYRTFMNHCMRSDMGASARRTESGKDPTKCCGLW